MKTGLSIALGWMALAAQACARLGETPAECEKRSIASRNRDKILEPIRRTARALYPQLPPFSFHEVTCEACNGPKTFALKVAGALVICSYDSVPALTAWADKLLAERAKANEPKKTRITGF
jgi:hypothetical protein